MWKLVKTDWQYLVREVKNGNFIIVKLCSSDVNNRNKNKAI